MGLDTDKVKIPVHLLAQEDPIFEFNKSIIKATHNVAVAFKLNTAFYEVYGLEGWRALQKNNPVSQQQSPRYFYYCRCQTRRYRKYICHVRQDVF